MVSGVHITHLTLEYAKQIAFSRNGECLSTTYRNSKTPMTWKCHQGHIWNIPLNNIKNSSSWCPYCAGHMKLTLEDAKQIALSRHGECLSTLVEIRNIGYWQIGHKSDTNRQNDI